MKGRAAIAAAAVVVAAGVGAAAIAGAAGGGSELASVRRATSKYHRVAVAEADGYESFLDCFDAEAGGMGQHYVDLPLDDVVDAAHPEAMVYEVRGDDLKLVSVEYIVPNSEAVAADPPRLLGETFHLNEVLDVWVLHAWIWRHNPTGMFEDWNPDVGACPEATPAP